jgi:AraC-like DNA-binding protein
MVGLCAKSSCFAPHRARSREALELSFEATVKRSSAPRREATKFGEIPAVHALHLADVAERFGADRKALFAGLVQDEAALADPRERISARTVEALIERARAMTHEPGLGFSLGLQMRISAHGYLGFAAMVASTLRGALEVAARFAPTRTDAFALRIEETAGDASIVIEELASFGAARDVVLIALVVGIDRLGSALTGHDVDGVAELALPAPAYLPRFAPMIGRRMRFGRKANRLVVRSALLDEPLVMADPAAHRSALEQCERELDALGAAGSVVARVRSAIASSGFRPIDHVAAKVHLSARTLRRRLAVEGTDYSTLVDEMRLARAELLLRDADRSIESIALELGYSDAANFTRAFRRWTGETPRSRR